MTKHAVAISLMFLRSGVLHAADDCSPELALKPAVTSSVKRASELEGRIRPLLDQMEAINKRAKDPSRSIADQLSQTDLDDLNKTNVQLRYFTSLYLFESTRRKQLSMVAGLLRISERMHDFRVKYVTEHGTLDGFDLETVANGTDEQLFLRTLLAMECALDPKAPGCSEEK